MKEIILIIPNHFVDEYNKDRFQDSLKRCLWCLQNQHINGLYIGRYEIETLYMLYESILEFSPVGLRGRIEKFIKTGEIEDVDDKINDIMNVRTDNV